MPNSLEKYYQKRKADQTPEPYGAGRTAPGVFVVHKHWARQMHYDLRLEINGTLRSWAVPRGPSLNPKDKRLAVHVEDHPIDYADFEGLIPEGNYGAGAMVIWDRGVWSPLEEPDGKHFPGKILFSLAGFKLGGVWTLIKTKGGADNEWLLIKKPDEYARDEGYEPLPYSVVSGLTVEELKAGRDKNQELLARAAELKAPQEKPPFANLKAMLAQTAEDAFSSEEWIFELKYDGYRLLCAKDGKEVFLRYRSGVDATPLYPDIVSALKKLPVEQAIFDGEVVVLDASGKPNFQSLQRRAQLTSKNDIERARHQYPATLFLFDFLSIANFDLRAFDTLTRKALLAVIAPKVGTLRYSDHVETQGEAFLAQIKKLNLEGMVAKRKNASYRPGRSSDWLKFRTEQTDEFVVVGFTLPKEHGLPGFSALHLAQLRGDSLVYAGRVGSGMTHEQRSTIRSLLEKDKREKPAFFGDVPYAPTKSVWVKPLHLAEVRFLHRTEDGLLRHPVFVDWRNDKSITDIKPLDTSPERVGPQKPDEKHGKRVVLTNLEKIFWPEEEYTKGDLINYYRAIAPWILPYLRNRMVVLTRYPDGISGKNFYQKDAPPFIPPWIETRRMWSEHSAREIDYFVCNDLESLLFLVNLGSIPLHIWASSTEDLQKPDWTIIDLDPKGASFSNVVVLAKAVRTLCQEIALPSFVKTSGSTGLHVLIPLGRQLTYEQGRHLAELLANVVVSRFPEIATVERNPRKREGKVYLDYLQNRHGQLLVAPFCVRPLKTAPVSAPLEWREVNAKLTPDKFTIKNAVTRMRRKKKDPMVDVLHQTPDLGHSLALLTELVENAN